MWRARTASGLSEPGPRIKDLTWETLQAFDVGTAKAGQRLCAGASAAEAGGGGGAALEEVVALAKGAGRSFLLFVELKCDAAKTAPIPLLWRMPPMT